jgi:hypothetical protein
MHTAATLSTRLLSSAVLHAESASKQLPKTAPTNSAEKNYEKKKNDKQTGKQKRS